MGDRGLSAPHPPQQVQEHAAGDTGPARARDNRISVSDVDARGWLVGFSLVSPPYSLEVSVVSHTR